MQIADWSGMVDGGCGGGGASIIIMLKIISFVFIVFQFCGRISEHLGIPLFAPMSLHSIVFHLHRKCRLGSFTK